MQKILVTPPITNLRWEDLHLRNHICHVLNVSRPAILGLLDSLQFGPVLVFVDEGNAELSKFNEERCDIKVRGRRIFAEAGMEYLGLSF